MNTLLRRCALAVALGGAAAHSWALEINGVGGFSYRVPGTTSLQAQRFQATVRQQFDFSCGSAAVATLLTHHYGYPVTEQTAFEQMYLRGDQAKIRAEGFSLLDMKRFLEAHGFAADGFEVSLEQVSEAGIPAIALISDNGYHHFVVIKGLRAGRVLVGDPSRGTRVMSQGDFQAMWQNRLVFVIHNRRDAAGFNQPADWKATPLAPLGVGVQHDGLAGVTLPRFEQGDF